MTEPIRDGDKKASEPPNPDSQTSDAKSSTPGAKDAKRQDKTKDKPDSGQNEDG